jgi:hypothetical protein
MEIWTSKVTFAHCMTGEEKVVVVRKSFKDAPPMIHIVDELVERAYEYLPRNGNDYEMIYSDEEQVS